jgi:hypothetical protein
MVLGAFLATEKILNETENGFILASPYLDLDPELEPIVIHHFPLQEKKSTKTFLKTGTINLCPRSARDFYHQLLNSNQRGSKLKRILNAF